MAALWESKSFAAWRAALASYEAVVAAQGVASLVKLDTWYRETLPGAITARPRPHVTHAELVRLTEWKMARGVWRARNLALVRGNEPADVVALSTEALAEALGEAPHPTAPIGTLSQLAGVGPATASAVMAAAVPAVYPFFDELVAAQIPKSGPVAFTLSSYARYADSLRERAARLAHGWTPVMAERALWAHAGGKAGITPQGTARPPKGRTGRGRASR